MYRSEIKTSYTINTNQSLNQIISEALQDIITCVVQNQLFGRQACNRCSSIREALLQYITIDYPKRLDDSKYLEARLKEKVELNTYLNVDKDFEREYGYNHDHLNFAIDRLKLDGYKILYMKLEDGEDAYPYRVLVKESVSKEELRANRDKIIF